MRRFRHTLMAVAAILLLGSWSQAELQLVEDFETQATATIDGKVPSGVLGGFWDTQSEATGNCIVGSSGGNKSLNFWPNSGGSGRGAALAGLTNPIEGNETGVVFFRFMVRTESAGTRSYFGLHALTGTDPLVTAQVNDPAGAIVAGFGALSDGAGPYTLFTPDGATVLKRDMTRDQWYNCWIVADNASDLYDLYIAGVDGPAGPATLPGIADLVVAGQPFGVATTNPITGVLFIGATGTGGATRTYADSIYWDGDAGLKSLWALNPIPAVGATGILHDQVLNWEAPDEPGIGQILGYSVYLDPNGVAVANSEAFTLKSANQTATSYDPTPDLAYDTTYYWRINTTLILADDPNQTHRTLPGRLWRFTTRLSNPVFVDQPVSLLLDAGQSAEFTVSVSSLTPVSYTWFKSDDATTSTPTDDVQAGSGMTLSLPEIHIAQEGYYYCKASNAAGDEFSEAVSLGIRQLEAHWTLDAGKVAEGSYLDETGRHNAAIADPADPIEFVTGMDGTENGAVLFDPNSNASVGTWNPSEFSNQLTISAWFIWDGSTLQEFGDPIIEKIDAYGPDTMMWALRVRDITDGKAGIRFYNASGMTIHPQGIVSPNEWTHVCVTFDGQTARMFVNGQLVGTDTTAALGTGYQSIMSFPTGDFSGAIDDLRLFNYPLPLTGVIDLYSAVSGENFCILTGFDNRYDQSGPLGEPDCKIDLYDLALFTSNWLQCGLYPNCP